LLVEDWGGDTVCISISAKEKKGISDLLENLLVVAEVEDLKADPSQLATGVVIESEMDKSKGPLATVLVHSGTLMVGDITTAGITWGRVKAMFNDIGKRVRKAGPAMPVEILGLNVVPQVGDILTAVIDERQAQALIEKHKHETEPESALLSKSVSLYNLFDQIRTGRMKELNAILKTDVQGSIEPLRGSLERLGTDEVKVRIIRSAAGNVTESDVMLATASKGLILGFGVSADLGARRLAEIENVDIRFYDVIYNLVADVEKALKGMLEPTIVDVVEGHAEVKAVFSLGKSGKVAGVYVTDGKISRNSTVRVRRGKQILHEANVNSLRRFKDDIKETTAGYECGVGVIGFNNFETGDVLEFYHKEKSE
jgi:translation initiation factor IF-2